MLTHPPSRTSTSLGQLACLAWCSRIRRAIASVRAGSRAELRRQELLEQTDLYLAELKTFA